ncbi:MAG: response regulator transcription factor [Thermoleophilia bacterium]
MNTAQPAVLIVEDDESIVEAVSFHLARAGMTTVSALDGLAGLRHLRTSLPDVLVLDLMLPHVDGWHIIREVRDWAPKLPIIVVTARTNEHDRVEVLKLGADDVLAKPFSMRELTARIGAVLRRAAADDAQESPEPLREGDLHIDLDRMAVTIAGEPVALTPLEFRLLCALAQQRDRALPRDVIHRAVWGVDRGHGDRSVDVLVRRLRRKIDEIPGRFTYIQTHHGLGYRCVAIPRTLTGRV